MKTLKWLKITAVVQGIYALTCAVSLGLIACADSVDDLIFRIGETVFFTGELLPIAPVLLFLTMFAYLRERGVPAQKELIGRKWLWMFLQFVVTIFILLVSLVIFVALTGGK